MRVGLLRWIVGAMLLVVCPTMLRAQSALGSIAGVVRDASGAVLPGVSVEASSPALIEKTRTVVTDGNGLYRIVDLRPGIYSVTFTIEGFGSVKRENIELTANFTAPINAELSVGDIQETITVAGAAPVVDVTSVGQRTAVTRQILDTVPTGRNLSATAILVPGTSYNASANGGGSDVGGSNGITKQYLQYHGSPDSVNLIDGLRSNIMASSTGSNSQNYWPDGMIQEISIVTSDGTAEGGQDGLRYQIVPKDGGNSFHTVVFYNYTDNNLQSNNFNSKLADRHTTEASRNKVTKIFDFNPSFGGPLKRDRLWFFSMFRYWGVNLFIANCVNPATGGQCPKPEWIYSGLGRMTWQMDQKSKLAFYLDKQKKTSPNYNTSATRPTGTNGYQWTRNNYVGVAKFTSTLTNKLLLEAGWSTTYIEYVIGYAWYGAKDGVVHKTPATQDLGTGVWSQASNEGDIAFPGPLYSSMAALSYVTGSHSFKTGMSLVQGWNCRCDVTYIGDVTLQTRNGAYVGAVLQNSPLSARQNLNADMGLFVQDQWKFHRSTITAGLRYDYFNAEVPAQDAPAGTWVPARHTDAIKNVPNWKDLAPRVGIVHDLFGNGKTALKSFFGRYVVAGANTNFASAVNPLTAQTDARTWTDPNKDGIVQLEELGPSTNSRFATGGVTTTQDPRVGAGWFVRPQTWHLAAGIQQEIMRGVSLDVMFHHKSWGNLSRAVNVLRSLNDYQSFTIVSPLDGQSITMYDVVPTKASSVQNVVKFSSDYGEETQIYDGLDVTMSGRFGAGGVVQGGMSGGQVRTHSINMDNPNFCTSAYYGATRQCDISPPFNPQFKFVGSYPLPMEFNVSAALQIVPGPEIRAIYNVNSAIAQPTLGRALSTSSIAVDLIPRGTQYGDTLRQLDVRLMRTFHFGKYSVKGQFDVYNALNTNAVANENTTYGSLWRQPLDITLGRLVKFGAQLDF